MSTIERNAEACEEARSKRCECACGGEFHGRKHSAAWMREIFVAAQDAQRERAATKSKAAAEDAATKPRRKSA